jgi:hypothetical protein
LRAKIVHFFLRFFKKEGRKRLDPGSQRVVFEFKEPGSGY